jgi:hypothetical protein
MQCIKIKCRYSQELNFTAHIFPSSHTIFILNILQSLLAVKPISVVEITIFIQIDLPNSETLIISCPICKHEAKYTTGPTSSHNFIFVFQICSLVLGEEIRLRTKLCRRYIDTEEIKNQRKLHNEDLHNMQYSLMTSV